MRMIRPDISSTVFRGLSVNKNVIEWLYRHIKGFDRSVAEYKFMNESSERL